MGGKPRKNSTEKRPVAQVSKDIKNTAHRDYLLETANELLNCYYSLETDNRDPLVTKINDIWYMEFDLAIVQGVIHRLIGKIEGICEAYGYEGSQIVRFIYE